MTATSTAVVSAALVMKVPTVSTRLIYVQRAIMNASIYALVCRENAISVGATLAISPIPRIPTVASNSGVSRLVKLVKESVTWRRKRVNAIPDLKGRDVNAT